jgi:pilus assembly protein CpaF
MIKLTMTEKGGDPRALSFDKDEVTIGRVSGNDIVLPKGNVSKRHSRILLKDGHVEISDLKSTNGTYVNGKKITDTVVLGATDRVYVGDFLITIDGLGGEMNAPARRGPPPPPPPRAGSSSVKLATLDDQTNTGAANASTGDEEDELGLAAKPPRAGRMPPPPPPPPRRPPTPLATKPLLDDDDDEALGQNLPAPSPAELAAADDSTNNMGLFERKTSDHSAFDGAGGRAPSTGNHPGAFLPPEPAPLPATPGQPVAPAFSTSEPAAAASSGEGLDGLLADPTVVQVIIAGPDATYVDRGAGPTLYAAGLGDPNAVADILWRIANTAVPPPSPDNPVVDVRLPDGSRLAAVFPPIAASGVVGSIRRAPQTERALIDLIPPGAKDVQTLLEAAVAGQRNLLLTGDASALPALATALAALVPADRRVVSLGGPLARGRAGWIELHPAGDLAALVRVASTFRADHLIVGDVLGVETIDLLLAAARGQEGLLLAMPARSVAEGLARVEALALPALGAGAGAAAPLVCSTIELVVHVVANADGSARIVDLAEPKMDGGRLGAEAVVSWRGDGGRRAGGAGKLSVSGVSARLGAALAGAGQSLPSNLVRR